MSTLYGVNKTKMLTPIGSNLLDQGVNKSKMCFMYDTIELSGAAAADVIQMGDKLPDGAVVVSVVCAFDDLGTGCTIDIGDADTVDRYGDGVDVASSAAIIAFPIIAEIAGMGYQVIEDTSDQIQITLNTSAASGTVKLFVQYAI